MPLRTRLDLVASAALAVAILAAAAGSSIQYDILVAGRPARWVALGVLGLAAFFRAMAFRSEWRLRPSVVAGLAALCAFCVTSSGWSVVPRQTFDRALSVCIVVAVAATLAGSTAQSPATARRLLDGILGATAVLALAGFVYWLIDPARAVQVATTVYPARFQGILQNPNTPGMLLAVGMPIALWHALTSVSIRRAAPFLVLLVAFAAEIVASGSRGGLAAGFLSLLVVPALMRGPRRNRLGVAVGVAASLVVAAWVMTLPQALPSSPVSAPPAPLVVSHSQPLDAETVLPLRSEIGGPWWTQTSGTFHRTLFGTSVRSRAWTGAIDQARQRPVLGYGFGAEQPAFVDRYYGFNSDNPENGYIGLFLQIGLAGLAVFLAVAVLCLVPAVRASLRGRDESERGTPAAVGAAAAGLLLGLSQSYFHAAGNVAFLGFWVALLLASAAGLRSVTGAAGPS
jgi:hypothetical protein